MKDAADSLITDFWYSEENTPINNNNTIYLIFRLTRRITPKRVTSLRSPSPRHSAKTTQLFLRRCWSGGEPFKCCV